MMVPALTTLAIVTLIGTWNNYLWPLIIGSDESVRVLTVALGIFRSQTPQGSPDWTGLMAGTTIGYSGTTGYTSGPHLHFVVQRLVRQNQGFATVSLPLRFYVGDPPYVFEPRYQHWLTADYSSPGKAPLQVNDRRLR